MSAHWNQIWVTSTLNVDEMGNSLVMLYSTQVLTSYNVAGMVYQNTKPYFMTILNDGVDILFVIDENWNYANLQFGNYSKLYSLTLQFEQFDFQPIVVKKCNNDIFVKNSSPYEIRCVKNLHVCIFQTSFGNLLKHLLAALQMKNSNFQKGHTQHSKLRHNFATVWEKLEGDSETGDILMRKQNYMSIKNMKLHSNETPGNCKTYRITDEKLVNINISWKHLETKHLSKFWNFLRKHQNGITQTTDAIQVLAKPDQIRKLSFNKFELQQKVTMTLHQLKKLDILLEKYTTPTTVHEKLSHDNVHTKHINQGSINIKNSTVVNLEQFIVSNLLQRGYSNIESIAKQMNKIMQVTTFTRKQLSCSKLENRHNLKMSNVGECFELMVQHRLDNTRGFSINESLMGTLQQNDESRKSFVDPGVKIFVCIKPNSPAAIKIVNNSTPLWAIHPIIEIPLSFKNICFEEIFQTEKTESLFWERDLSVPITDFWEEIWMPTGSQVNSLELDCINGKFYSEDFYHQTISTYQECITMQNNIVSNWLSYCQEKAPNEKLHLQILEIGNGTDWMTKDFLETLTNENVEFNYTYTYNFAPFPNADKTVTKYRNRFSIQNLHLNIDPISQGFGRECYDYIYANNSLDTCDDILECMENAHMLLKPFGRFDLIVDDLVKDIYMEALEASCFKFLGIFQAQVENYTLISTERGESLYWEQKDEALMESIDKILEKAFWDGLEEECYQNLDLAYPTKPNLCKWSNCQFKDRFKDYQPKSSNEALSCHKHKSNILQNQAVKFIRKGINHRKDRISKIPKAHDAHNVNKEQFRRFFQSAEHQAKIFCVFFYRKIYIHWNLFWNKKIVFYDKIVEIS